MIKTAIKYKIIFNIINSITYVSHTLIFNGKAYTVIYHIYKYIRYQGIIISLL